MKNKIFDSEIKVMEIVWENEPITAKQVSVIAAQTIGWNKNTTYTVIKKLEAKGFIKRDEPNFVCTSLVSRDEVRREETHSLIDKLFGGSKKALFSSLSPSFPLFLSTCHDTKSPRKMQAFPRVIVISVLNFSY